MKVLYSQIKQMVPSLQASAAEIGESLTMIGFMMDDFKEITWQGKKDWLISLEIRQNRGDCLSVLGIAREVAAYYDLPVILPETKNWEVVNFNLNIKVEASSYVKRILAIKLDNLKNAESPAWLKELLAFYDLNSINLLVDISNYVMLVTGYTSHLLNADAVRGALNWKINEYPRTIETLDGSEIALKTGELIIEDEENILALAGIVGCSPAAISRRTTNIIAEMAIYDRAIIKRNSRDLAVVTEASNRLSKDMSLESMDFAFQLLISTILDLAGGEISSSVYSYYPVKQTFAPIKFNPELPTRFAGIDIPVDKVRTILSALRFAVDETDATAWLVTAPSDRSDVNLAEDIVEDVLRLVRYDAIPANELPLLAVTPDITPRIWHVKESIRDILSFNAYDEILSQPLVSVDSNTTTAWGELEPILTINSVNDEYPALRQSLASGLLNQLAEHRKKNAVPSSIFEIGKVFGRDKSQAVIEQEFLGILSFGKHTLKTFQTDLENLLGNFGLSFIDYEALLKPLKVFNPHSAWLIKFSGQTLGVLAKLTPLDNASSAYYAELNLNLLSDLSSTVNNFAVAELTGKLIALDANIELDIATSVPGALASIKEKMGTHYWSIAVIDKFELKDKVRYTVRAVYQGLADQEAKDLHAQVFLLN